MPAGNKRPPAPSEATPLVSKGSSGLPCLATRDAATTTTIVIVLFAILLKQASNASVAASLSEMRAIGRPEVALYFPALGSVFYGLGKVNNIFITYRIGPRIVLNLSALVSGAFYLLIVATSVGPVALMGACVAVCAFSNAHVWGAATRILASWVDRVFLGRSVAIGLACGNDLGDMLGPLAFSALQAAFPYHSYAAAFAPFAFMGILLLILAAVEYFLLKGSSVEAGYPPPTLPAEVAPAPAPTMFGKDQSSSGSEQSKTTYVTGGLLSRFGTISRDLNTTEVASAPSDAKVSPLLEEETEEMEKRTTRHPLDEVELIPAVYTFWLRPLLAGVCAQHVRHPLLCVGLVPSYLFATSALGYSDSAATLLLTAGATGSLFGNLIGGTGLTDVTACQSVVRPIRILFQALALFAYGITVCLGFGLTDGPIGPNSTASMIASLLPMLLPLYSVALAIHWNIYLNYFIIRFGGPKHSATLTGLLDAGSFIVAIPYQLLLGRLSADNRWTAVVPHDQLLYVLLPTFVFANALLIVDARSTRRCRRRGRASRSERSNSLAPICVDAEF